MGLVYSFMGRKLGLYPPFGLQLKVVYKACWVRTESGRDRERCNNPWTLRMFFLT